MKNIALFFTVTLTVSLFFTSKVMYGQEKVIFTSQFEGRSDHTVTGKVSIVETESGFIVRLEEDFVLDGAPDPKVALGKDGFQEETLVDSIIQTKGLQEYILSEDIDPNKYNEIYIWCEQFNVPLGVAEYNQ